MKAIWFWVAAAWLAAAGAVNAATPAKSAGKTPAVVEGLITLVPEGDSLWVTPADKPAMLLQLNDIDAPEPCQVYGEESRRALAELALNRRATVKIQGRDAQGRTLAVVLVDGADLSVRMVEEGHAWSTRTKWDFGPLVQQERMARALNRGLHASGGAMMPREFRQMHGPCPGAAAPPVAAPAPTATARAATPSAATRVAAPATPAFRCDGRTRCTQMRSCAEAQYFLANCPGVQLDGDRNGVPCEAQWCGRR
jgi:endonuclease YncB( thermonuclease family)